MEAHAGTATPAPPVTDRPRGAWLWIAAAALTLGAVLATVGSWVGWRQASPSPTRAQALAALETGLPGIPVGWIGWHDDVHDVHGIDDPDARNLPGQQQASYAQGVSRASFDEARARLAAAGWQVRREPDFFVASRGDLVMEWEFAPAGRYRSPGGDSIEVWLWRTTPGSVDALTLLGWLVGAAGGAFAARGVSRMRPGPARSAFVGTGVTAMVLLALSTAVVAYLTVHNVLGLPARGGQPIALWFGYYPFLLLFGYQMG